MTQATRRNGVFDPLQWLLLRVALAAAGAAFADWLLFGYRPGVSLALFLAALAIASVCVNPLRARKSIRIAACALLAVSLLALVEEVDALSFALALIGTASFALLMASSAPGSWQRFLALALGMLFIGPFRLANDMRRITRRLARTGKLRLTPGVVVAWIVPAVLLGVFLFLFSLANPLIEDYLRAIDISFALDLLKSWRALFWLAIFCAIWPMIHVPVAHRRFLPAFDGPAPILSETANVDLLGAQATLRSLVLLNALFALQTMLDLTYLWGGLALPDGMTFAQYAHRGAYPLILTAILAAVLVLIAMREGGPAKSSRLIRTLVLAFVGQNILLVASSMLRLNLYVAAYELTLLRAATFVWFLLVALGLVLIVVKIVRDRPLSWLIAMNAGALAVTLYGACFVNISSVIANYNVDHCIEVSGEGSHLDMGYLKSLGPQAIPALDRYAKASVGDRSTLEETRAELYAEFIATSQNWRGWGFRAWRLEQYLAKDGRRPAAPEARMGDLN